MDTGPNGEEPTSWEELYSINLMPSELSFKFRKEVQGLRVGVNLEVLSFDFYKILTRFMFKFLEFIRCAYYWWRKVFFFFSRLGLIYGNCDSKGGSGNFHFGFHMKILLILLHEM